MSHYDEISWGGPLKRAVEEATPPLPRELIFIKGAHRYIFRYEGTRQGVAAVCLQCATWADSDYLNLDWRDARKIAKEANKGYQQIGEVL